MDKPLLKNIPPYFSALTGSHRNAQIFLVGGAVRDALLNRPSKDQDFMITGVELEILVSFFEKFGTVNLVGKRFGVIKFRAKKEKEFIDIALPRKERSLSFTGGYKDFEIHSDHNLPVEQDLARRDFTINAMAYNVMTQELIDPFLGKKDLADKKIRTVGVAAARFQEDYSRMLRAIRFACQLEFAISAKTKAAIKKLAYHLNDQIDKQWVVAREVIAKEFLKGFDAAPVRCLKLMDELNVLQAVLPEIKSFQKTAQSPPFHLEGNVFNHATLALDQLQSKEFKKYFPDPPDLLTKLGALFHDLGKIKTASKDKKGIHFYGHDKVGAELIGQICKRLALGSSAYFPFSCDKLQWLVRSHMFSISVAHSKIKATKLEELFFSSRWPSQSLLQIMLADQLASVSTKKIDNTAPFKELWKRLQKLAPGGKLPPPLLTGKEVVDLLSIKEGPVIKSILIDLREEQLQQRITSKAEAKQYISQKHGNE